MKKKKIEDVVEEAETLLGIKETKERKEIKIV